MRCRRRALALAFSFSTLLAQQALAESINVCNGYADEAVSTLVKQAVDACGYDGPAWRASRQDHFNWCRRASPEAVASERNNRNTWASRCTECHRYAKTALKQQQKNVNLKCGFTGDGWSDNFAGHKSWCFSIKESGGDLSQVIANQWQESQRNGMLKQCEAKAETCKTYAKLAGDAARDNVLFGCRLTGARFGTGDHYGWCMENDAAAAAREQTGRTNAIAICRKEFTETEIQGCRNYATTAVNQWKRSKIVASGCKFGGPRWHANWDAHFAWCIGNFRGFEGTNHGALLMTSENAARTAEMKGCVGRSVNRDQRFPTRPSSQGKALSSKNDAASKSNQRGVLEGGGLLDTNQGIVRQGPSPTGTPGGGAGGSAPPSRGGGASTLR